MTNAKCADQMKTFEKRRKIVVNIYRNGDFKKVYLKKNLKPIWKNDVKPKNNDDSLDSFFHLPNSV